MVCAISKQRRLSAALKLANSDGKALQEGKTYNFGFALHVTNRTPYLFPDYRGFWHEGRYRGDPTEVNGDETLKGHVL